MANKRLLELALKGLEVERGRIDKEMADLESQMNGAPAVVAFLKHAQGKKTKRGLSIAGRKAISEAMKRRWAEKRNGTNSR